VTATFLVQVEVDNADEIDAMADELFDSLQDDSFTVVSVKPWARPTQGVGQPEAEGGFSLGGETLF